MQQLCSYEYKDIYAYNYRCIQWSRISLHTIDQFLDIQYLARL